MVQEIRFFMRPVAPGFSEARTKWPGPLTHTTFSQAGSGRELLQVGFSSSSTRTRARAADHVFWRSPWDTLFS